MIRIIKRLTQWMRGSLAQEIDRGRRRQADRQGRASTPADDAALLRSFKGATFGPGCTVVLPTGRVLTGAEVALWVDVENS
jgi:hypothetical protein